MSTYIKMFRDYDDNKHKGLFMPVQRKCKVKKEPTPFVVLRESLSNGRRSRNNVIMYIVRNYGYSVYAAKHIVENLWTNKNGIAGSIYHYNPEAVEVIRHDHY